jgi:hypothetical protein
MEEENTVYLLFDKLMNINILNVNRLSAIILNVKLLSVVVQNVGVLSVIMLNFDMFSVVILNGIRLSVFILNVCWHGMLSGSFLSANRLNVVVPRNHFCLDGH